MLTNVRCLILNTNYLLTGNFLSTEIHLVKCTNVCVMLQVASVFMGLFKFTQALFAQAYFSLSTEGLEPGRVSWRTRLCFFSCTAPLKKQLINIY